MDRYTIHDSQPGMPSSHRIEVRSGWKTLAGLSVEDRGKEWFVHSVMVKPECRGEGHSRRLLGYVEKEYGPFVVESANDSYWLKSGYRQRPDGYWAKVDRLKVRSIQP